MTAIAVERVDELTSDVRSLIFELDSELAVAYPPEQMHGLGLRALFEPNVRFFLARIDGAAIGCCGVAFFDGFAEVTRMYVRKSERGVGVAQMLLETVEGCAREAGYALLRLEIGVRQPAAIRLYESVGFRPRSVFGRYIDMPPAAIKTSLYYEKAIA
jgi:putative acetyltransferase